MARIVHIALKVDDLEKTSQFYEKVFGFQPVETSKVRDHTSRHLSDGAIAAVDGSGVVTVLHSFTGTGASGGTGSTPSPGLIRGSDGNYYGAASNGGANGFGTIFRMDGSGVVTVLHSFTGSGASSTGSTPFAGLIQGIDGNFYGTAVFGGVNNLGTIFRMDGSGVVTVLHSFTGSGASGTGSNPFAGLVQGSDGNFYGTTRFGGVNNLGTIFRMDGSGVVTVLHSFTGSGASGAGSNPFAGLVQGSDGNFYGTTQVGGVNNLGTIFRMDGSGVVTVLHSFTGSGASGAGSNPFAGLVQGSDGNFYGTTQVGGVNNLGTIFRMDGSGVVTVLHSFTGSGASGTGSNPVASLVQGSDGNFYGTTRLGGVNDLGTIFRMDGSGVVTVLHSFTGSGASGTGSSPAAGLVRGSDGNFYGTAEGGGANSIGTIFRVNLSLPTDGTAPETTILTNPVALTNSTSATFTFTSTEAGTFECKLDSGSFAACSSPQTYNGLSEGNHSFQVRAKDLAGNTDQTPASFSWMIDIIPPATTITANPPATTNSTSATFEFTSTEAGSTFACNLDGAGFTTCASPQSYNSLAGGNHNFQVRAIDAAGNFDTTPASYNWTITTGDITPPETTITVKPQIVTSGTNAIFEFTSNETGAFACSLDGSPLIACTSPTTYNSLASGSHSFQVAATDLAGNTDPTPASYTWTIDFMPPDTTITSAPPVTTNSTSATFSFTSTEANSNFRCSLDGAPTGGCTSPQTYTGLHSGSHTFEVQATDAAGNSDLTPATHAWTIDTAPPETTITVALATTNSTSATFSFISTEANSNFRCSLDGAPTGPCTSPQTYTGLTSGSHTFEVQATDAAGNSDLTPATHTWTIAANTIIDSSPMVLTNSADATFSFFAGAAAAFECSLDGGVFNSCASPTTYNSLANGVHTFEVRSINASGTPEPIPGSYSWTIVPLSNLADTTIADFTSGTRDSATYIAHTTDGEIILAPRFGAEFSTAVPPPWQRAGNSVVSAGVNTMDGGYIVTPGPGSFVEFTATFDQDADQLVGLNSNAPSLSPPFAVFRVIAGQLYAFSTAGNTPIPGNWFGIPHRYRIELNGSNTSFLIDGQVVAVQSALPQMFFLAFDSTADGNLLSLDWVRVGPYQSSGTFLSRVFDAGSLVNWNTATWTGDTPAGTSLQISVRQGNTPIPDATWTSFVALASPGSSIGGTSRYLQYRADLATHDPNQTPVLNDISFISNHDTQAPDTTITDKPSDPTNSTSATFRFISTEANSTFECKLDSGSFSSCTTPKTYTSLTEGSRNFSVRAIDAAGNIGTAASYTWTIDIVPPETTITSKPPTTTNSTSATFTSARLTQRPRLNVSWIPSLTSHRASVRKVILAWRAAATRSRCVRLTQQVIRTRHR